MNHFKTGELQKEYEKALDCAKCKSPPNLDDDELIDSPRSESDASKDPMLMDSVRLHVVSHKHDVENIEVLQYNFNIFYDLD